MMPIHHVDARLILQLLPHADQDLLRDVRTEVARRTQRVDSTDWREAWNQATGATPNRLGFLEFHTHLRCPQCSGKRIDLRTGTACTRCIARGRVYERVRLTALYANPEPTR